MPQQNLRHIAEDVCRVLRAHAEKAELYRREYASKRSMECAPDVEGAKLMMPAGEDLRCALETYADALFELTGWGAPYDAGEPDDPDEEEP